MAKKNGKDPDFKTVTVRKDVYEALDKKREKKRTELGLFELSWSNFLGMVAKEEK